MVGGTNQTTTVFVPPLPQGVDRGELNNVLCAGISGHPDIEPASSEAAADFVLVDFRHLLHDHYEIVAPEKTVIIDYRDQWTDVFPHDALLYFKRAVTHHITGELVEFDRAIHPISYCVRDEYAERAASFPAERDIDVSVFFDPVGLRASRINRFRADVAETVSVAFSDRNIQVGHVGLIGRSGRNEFQQEYFDAMARSKIIVTCNPNLWEGDYRLFESLCSGALVLCDTMAIPMPHPFVHREHLVYYDRTDMAMLVKEIERYLDDDEARTSIARAGYEHAMAHHRASDRIGQVIDLARVAAGL